MDDFAYLILEVVNEIPKGKVSSYGDIAKIAGYPKNARKVGKVLSNAEFFGDYPCHRVIHSDGTLVMGWDEQESLLLEEGVKLKPNKKVDMKLYKWKP
ncbi:MGMT family protein [Breznakia pachnodae]|uniref:Methylated-DNA-protein-cysteine methyltransferase-like protein n=1 Tax=Breznakia pachnodae TaxID=265178 RepID=A0ABU0DXN4_9FIRM|nr:methylated-DNA--[protein]-cysteine S-methyltransferase [Breznakia pachnodae]MDQ0359401.1 methylated-DNA-protein-cysteine methyltransferase-like protein [Breznakia pachnodae]